MALLDIHNLTVEFSTGSGAFRAVDGVSFTVDHHEVLAIVGESGSGKSVSMLALMGLLPWTAKITADRLEFDGKNLLTMGPKERRRIVGKDLAMIFQEPMSSLNPCFTVGYQLTEALKTHMDMSKAQRRARAIELLEQVGIPGAESRLTSFPHQLSGGMAQRVALARALVNDPSLLVLDEPLGKLDSLTRLTMQTELVDLWQRQRFSALLVTHDVEEALFMAQRVVVFSERPATIKQVLVNDLPYPRHRGDPRLASLRHQALALLGLDASW